MRFLEYSSIIDCPKQDLFDWHMQEDAFEQLKPSWEKVAVIKRVDKFPNTNLPKEIYLQTEFLGMKSEWHLKHVDFIYGEEFSDYLISGPFKYYKHRHLMKRLSENQTELIDQISFELPFGFLGDFFGYPIVKAKFDRLFAYRHAITTKRVLITLSTKSR